MEIAFLALALVPALALLFAPRSWLMPIGAVTVGLFVLCVLWAVSFANSCSSDGCIGVFILGAFTAVVGLSAAVAGAIRWAVIASRSRQDPPEE